MNNKTTLSCCLDSFHCSVVLATAPANAWVLFVYLFVCLLNMFHAFYAVHTDPSQMLRTAFFLFENTLTDAIKLHEYIFKAA